MLSRDYIMRMTNLLAKALARVLFLKEIKNYEEALVEVEKTGSSLLGLDLEVFEKIPLANVKSLLGSDATIRQSKLFAAGMLLKEKAEIRESQGEEEDSVFLNLKSLELLVEELPDSKEFGEGKWKQGVELLVERIKGYDRPIELKRRLAAYYEFVGEYDRLENTVFDILESDPGFVSDGILIYERLSRKTDDELESGKLPRNEVMEALEILRSHPGL
ncbi:MAG TPA: DUF6483 family protein [Candidatus Kryptonia bacterium]